MREFDGTHIPQMFQAAAPSSALHQHTNSFSLKEGVVTAIIYPDQKENISKKDIEYNVAIVEYIQGVGANLQEYRNCRIWDMFGATNNHLNYTMQPSSTKIDDVGGKANKTSFDDGNRVMLLCIGGVAQAGYAVIIGGLKHSDGKIYSSADGQFYDFNFNGIQQLINKDGELVITFNSPIDQKGKKANEKAAGTVLKIDKDGRWTVYDNENQAIKIDRVAKKIEIQNGSESIIVNKSDKSISLKSAGNITETAGKDMNLKSSSATKIESGGQMQLKSGGQLRSESAGTMEMKSGGQWRLQASGNVIIQSGGNVSLIGGDGPILQSQGPIVTGGNGGVPAAGVGISQAVGIGNLGFPVISTIITGSSTFFIGS